MKTPTLVKRLIAFSEYGRHYEDAHSLFAGWVGCIPNKAASQEIYKNATAPFDDEKSVDSVLPLPDDIVLVRARYQGGPFLDGDPQGQDRTF